MPFDRLTIRIEPGAPDKPAPAMPCNGCGVCCLVEPCPLGMVLSRRRRGACDALRWSPVALQYRCGGIEDSHAVMLKALPWGLRWAAGAMTAPFAKLARRWIAAGTGCDCTLEASRSEDASGCTVQPSLLAKSR